jgi:hypothetical protein
MENVSENSCGENQNTHFMISSFFLKVLFDNVGRYRAGQATGDDMLHAHRMLDT